MTEPVQDDPVDRHLRKLVALVSLALAAATISAVAGVLLLIIDPAEGSGPEATFGFTAAISGLASGALFIASFIYAQVNNLWQHASMAIRVVLWIIIGVGVVVSVISWFT